MTDRQSGIVAFLFTDVEGSTRLWEADQRAMSTALARHDALLHAAIAAAGGTVFKTAGDAFCAVFPTPVAAVEAAVAVQRGLAVETAEPGPRLKVRMAIHAGHAEERGGDYFGPPLNRVARLLSTAHGGQILLSRPASELARDQLQPDIALRDLGEHTLKDLQHAERVFQVIAPGLITDFPPLRTPRHLVRNVPQPATPLIGRERELAAAAALLGLSPPDEIAAALELAAARQTTRLLTLTGPGGAGKTRLALHLAAELGVTFGDGAAFVSLAELTDPALVAGEILDALTPGEAGGDPSRDRLFAELRERHLLLVLDNFEQIMDAVPLVSDLLSHCPRLCILVTSRERLSVRGEQELAIPPLALPEPAPSMAIGDVGAAGAPEALERIRCAEAVRLFVARAQSVKPGFEITLENAAAIVEICARLDGLPLAIELAAARLRLLSPRALLERFERRLDILDRGPRDLPARQQTMRDTIAWSYDLLDPAEQRAFTRLSVFAGGATLDAAESVLLSPPPASGYPAPLSEAPPFAPLELLESLADKSLIALSDEDEPRLTMLQTIRDYGRERLAESGEHDNVSQRHAELFLAFAEESEPLLAGREQHAWLDRLDREQANLRAAIGWLRDTGQREEALRLGGALWRFWWLRGDVGEGRALLETLLRESDGIDPAVRAKALNGAGILAECQGDWEIAARLHGESLDISRRLDDLHGVAWALNNLGVVAISQGDYARARALLEENLAVAEQTEDAESIAAALIDLGRLAHNEGDQERARALFTRSLELFRELGDESHVARALNNLGTVVRGLGDFDRARALLSESLALHRHVGDRQGIASTLINLGNVASWQGDFESAMGYFRESHILALEGGNHLYAAMAMEGLAVVTHHHGDEGVAQNRFREALRLFRGVGDLQGIITCLGHLASAAASHGHAREAVTLLGAAAGVGERHEHVALPDTEELVAKLRDTLGDEAFEAAWQEGQAARIEDVVDQLSTISL